MYASAILQDNDLVNVFATAAEAYEWVGSMSSRRDDSCSVDKRAYSVRFHTID